MTKCIVSIEEHRSLIQQIHSSIHSKIVGTVASLTKLSAAVVEGPADSDHMGIRLTTGKVLHRNLLIDLKNSEKSPVKQKPRDDFQEIFDT